MTKSVPVPMGQCWPCMGTQYSKQRDISAPKRLLNDLEIMVFYRCISRVDVSALCQDIHVPNNMSNCRFGGSNNFCLFKHPSVSNVKSNHKMAWSEITLTFFFVVYRCMQSHFFF